MRTGKLIVATPGRLKDLLDAWTGASVAAVRFVVLDEADHMLNDKIFKKANLEREVRKTATCLVDVPPKDP